ncbi:hypothetical protein AB0D12_02765 [Streptomyces sp. NPDC048479]|uniref:hypothetical protein n=1 Tax=Streptomyces sp. NPDC048479 TaxID=3154725 RepID=UPI0034148E47
MISPEKIPVFSGDLVELGREIIALRQAAKAIREHGGDVHTRFQHLGASYKAPEAGQLFATTQAVQDTSGTFADRLETVAGALETYAVEVVEIIKQLDMLRWQATVFEESVKDHDGPLENWRKDEDKVAEHEAIWDGVNAAIAAFQQAEVTCADKITALVDGTRWHINDGSPKQENPYGFSAEQLAQADSLPWGSPEHDEVLPFGIDYHLEQLGISVWDNASGSVEGLIDLFSPGEEGGAAREGLLRVVVGAEGYLLDPHGDRKDLSPFMKKFMGDSKPYAKEFGKSFVGWDDWSTNPGKAMGTVIFNGLTLGAGPLGAVSKAGSAAGKAGAAARVAGVLAKVGEVLDPIGAAAKTVGVAARVLPRVADLTAGVRAATDVTAAADATHSFIEFPDGSQLRVEDGHFIPGSKGVPDTTSAPHEPAATDRTPWGADNPHVPNPVREPALVGAGAAHAGDHAGGAIRVGGSIGDDLGDVGRAADNAPGANAANKVPGGAADNTSGGGLGDNMLTGRAGDNLPTNNLDNGVGGAGRAGDNTPTSGAGRTDTPSTGGRDMPGGSTADNGIPSSGHPETPGTGGDAHHEPPASATPDEATRAAHRAEYEASREVPPKERTSAERAATTREHVWLANNDPLWRAEHYDKWGPGKRNSADELVDGQLLPKLIEQPDGSWIAASSIPYADPGGFHLTPLERGPETVAPDDLTHLDEVAAKRMAGMDLTKREKAFDENPSFDNAYELAHAQEHYDLTVGEGVSNNTKLGEALGEEAARRHMLLQKEFEGAHEIADLPETANGSKRFDQLWRDKDGNLIIVEAKSPNGVLEWRQSNGHPGGKVMVKQGSLEYVRTIVADMKDRVFESPGEANYIKEIEDAIKAKTLRYVLVQATENTGTYAGSVLKHFKLF